MPIHPDATRPDLGAAFFSTWDVGTPERQRAAVEAIGTVWERRPWPLPGLLSYSVYAGFDGRRLLHHSQWAAEDAHHDFVRDQRQWRNEEIDAAVPGIERLGLVRARPYRSLAADGRDVEADGGGRPEPGCVVVVDVEFEGPDAGRQRAWADAVAEAMAADPAPPAGLIAAHFHISLDGTRVVNYAEWSSEQAHIDALAAPGEGIGSPSPLWERVHRFPGRRSDTVRRYHLLFSAARPEGAARAESAGRPAG